MWRIESSELWALIRECRVWRKRSMVEQDVSLYPVIPEPNLEERILIGHSPDFRRDRSVIPKRIIVAQSYAGTRGASAGRGGVGRTEHSMPERK